MLTVHPGSGQARTDTLPLWASKHLVALASVQVYPVSKEMDVKSSSFSWPSINKQTVPVDSTLDPLPPPPPDLSGL